MIKPVDTRWNSKSLMISRAIYLKPAIEDICSKKSLVVQYNTRHLKLKREEWVILEQLEPLLGVRHFSYFFLLRLISFSQAFYDISLLMQRAEIPLISAVIPSIDALVRVIDDFRDDTANHPAVRSAAMRGLNILNKYYQKSDESFVYRIAMGMLLYLSVHPTLVI